MWAKRFKRRKRRVRDPNSRRFNAGKDVRAGIEGREPRLITILAKCYRRVLQIRIESERFGERGGAAREKKTSFEAAKPVEDGGRIKRGRLNDLVSLKNPETVEIAGLNGGAVALNDALLRRSQKYDRFVDLLRQLREDIRLNAHGNNGRFVEQKSGPGWIGGVTRN